MTLFMARLKGLTEFVLLSHRTRTNNGTTLLLTETWTQEFQREI